MDSASAELGWAWYPTPTSPNQSPSLLIPPPNLSHLSHLLDSTVPGQVHAVALLRHLSNSCSHDLWVTLQLRRCVPNVCVITLLCSCLKPDGFLHMLSGSSLSSFTLHSPAGLALPSLLGSLAPSTGSLCPSHPGRVRLLQPCPDRGPPALAAAVSVPSVSAAPSSLFT